MARQPHSPFGLNLGLALGSLLSAGQALASDLPIADAECVPIFNGGNYCTSNALSFKAISIEPDRTHCNAGDELNLNIGITLGSEKLRNAAQRYNVGIWIGEHGEPAIGGSQCTFEKAVYPNVRPRLHNNVVTVSAQASNNQRSDGGAISASDQA